MIISHSRRFVFVHVPKAGGTSMEEALAPHLAWNDLILGTTELGAAMNAPFRRRYGLHDHAGVDEIVHVCGKEILEDYFSFALVRHPVERAISAYNFVHALCAAICRQRRTSLADLRRLVLEAEPETPEQRAAIAADPLLDWCLTQAYLGARDFSAFVRAPLALADPAFRPQTELLASLDGTVRVAEAIRLEDIAVALPRLGRRLGLDLAFGHANRAETRAIDRTDIAEADRIHLERIYEGDMLAFDYR